MPRTTEIQTSSSVGTRSVLLFTPVPSVSQGSPLPFPQPNFHLEVNGFLQLVGTILLRTRLPPLVFTHSVPSTASHWPMQAPVQSIAHSPVLLWVWLPDDSSARDKPQLKHQAQTFTLRAGVPDPTSYLHSTHFPWWIHLLTVVLVFLQIHRGGKTAFGRY